MSGISEVAVEQALLGWLAGLGWATAHGPDISPPDTRTPAQILRDTMLDGWIARLVRAKWQPVPEGVDPAAWPKAVDAMVDLILRAAPPARGGYSR